MRAGASVIDVTGGMFGVIGVLAALERRHGSGRGELVTGSLFETTAFLVGQHMAQQAVTGEDALPMSIRNSAWAIYDIFKCREGEKVFVGVVSDSQWRRFCDEFELGEFAADESLGKNNARVRRRDRILPAISRMFAAMNRDECWTGSTGPAWLSPKHKPSDLFDDLIERREGLLPLCAWRASRRNARFRLCLESAAVRPGTICRAAEQGRNLHKRAYSRRDRGTRAPGRAVAAEG